MSRSTYAPRAEFVGTGLLDTYSFDFKVTSLSQLLILVTDENFIETFKVRGDDTTHLSGVTFDGINGAGEIELLVNLPLGHLLTILMADDEPTQDSEFRNKNDFTLKRFEAALDALSGSIQRLAYLAKRSLKLGDSMTTAESELFVTELPVNTVDLTNAGKILVIGDDGASFDLGPNYHDIDAVIVTEAAAASATAAAASATAAAASATASSGSAAAAAASAALFPNQTGNAGKFLTTNGTVTAWDDTGSGVLVVTDYNGVLAIPTIDRTVGLIIHQIDSKLNWQYHNGITDADLVLLSYVHEIHPTALVLASGAPITLTTGVFDMIRTVSSSVTNGGLVTLPTGRRQGEMLGLMGGSDANPASIAAAANVSLGGSASISLSTTKMTEFVWVGTKWVLTGSSGGGGLLNFITNADAEANVLGWNLYKDAAGVRPVDGTGSTATNITFTSTSTAPLNGTKSFLLTKAASNGQGEGVSSDFNLPLGFRAKALTVKVPYIVSSGTFVAGNRTTDSDVIVYFYDITNSKLVEPSSFKFLSNSTTVSDAVQATVQFDSNCTSARMILHVATTSAAAYVLKLDDIQVGPTNYQYGTPITDWASFTPTGSWTGAVAYAGKKRCVGDNYEYDITVTCSGAPTGSSLIVNIPDTIDTAKLTQSQPNMVGLCVANDSLTTYCQGVVNINTTTSVLPTAITASGAYGTTASITPTTPFTFGSADSVQLRFSVPILGRSSSVQQSDQTDTRVVDFVGTVTTGAVTANVTNIPATVEKDSHNAWTGSTYVVQVPGDYNVSGFMYSVASSFNGIVFLNGIGKRFLFYSSAGVGGSGSVIIPNLKTGDILSVRSSGSVSLGSDSAQHISISRISGPSAIAASETVACSYANNSGQSITASSSIVLTGWTKEQDTHGFFNPTTGIATIPISGTYNMHFQWSVISGAASTNRYAIIYKNGFTYKQTYYYLPQSSDGCGMVVSADGVYLKAGETISFVVYKDYTGAHALNNGTQTYMSIVRTGI